LSTYKHQYTRRLFILRRNIDSDNATNIAGFSITTGTCPRSCRYRYSITTGTRSSHGATTTSIGAISLVVKVALHSICGSVVAAGINRIQSLELVDDTMDGTVCRDLDPLSDRLGLAALLALLSTYAFVVGTSGPSWRAGSRLLVRCQHLE